MSDDKVREMFDACTRRLDDYHFVQCMRTPRCTCHLAIVKDAILANFNAMHNAGIAAERERAARKASAMAERMHEVHGKEAWREISVLQQCAATIRAGGEA